MKIEPDEFLLIDKIESFFLDRYKQNKKIPFDKIINHIQKAKRRS